MEPTIDGGLMHLRVLGYVWLEEWKNGMMENILISLLFVLLGVEK